MKLKEMSSFKVEGGERGWWGSINAKSSEGERYLSLLHIYTRVSWIMMHIVVKCKESLKMFPFVEIKY